MPCAEARDLEHPSAEAEGDHAADEEAEGRCPGRAEIAAGEGERREGDPGESALVGSREGGDQEEDARERQSETPHVKQDTRPPRGCRVRRFDSRAGVGHCAQGHAFRDLRGGTAPR
jgi:hypothetical protein